jgi:hypothetical protein
VPAAAAARTLSGLSVRVCTSPIEPPLNNLVNFKQAAGFLRNGMAPAGRSAGGCSAETPKRITPTW